MRFVRFNANPWKQNIDDCVIRAITLAVGMKYTLVCKQLGVSWKNGKGLIRSSGIGLDIVKEKFDQYFDVVQDLIEDNYFTPDGHEDEDLNAIDDELGVPSVENTITLSEFSEMYKNQGVFLVNVNPNPNAKDPTAKSDSDGWHMVCVNCRKTLPQPTVYDTFDSREMFVNAFMRVKHQLSRNDPRHWIYDKQTNNVV